MEIIVAFLGLLALFVGFSFVRRGIDPNYRKRTDDLYGLNKDKDGTGDA